MEPSTDENGERPLSYKKIQLWSDGDTRHLLDLYSNYMKDIGPMKKFETKKDMWVEISLKITTKAPKQCEERYKTVLKRKKVAVENNKATGSRRQNIDFEDELNKICQMDDSIEPEVQISSQKIIKVEKKGSENCEYAKRKKKTIQETLQDIADKKEEAKERRHREKMVLLEKILEEKDK